MSESKACILISLPTWIPIPSSPFVVTLSLPINRRRKILVLVMTGRSDMDIGASEPPGKQLDQGAKKASKQRGAQEAGGREGSCQHDSEVEGGECN